jgi:hypothetical protein
MVLYVYGLRFKLVVFCDVIIEALFQDLYVTAFHCEGSVSQKLHVLSLTDFS